MDKAPKKAVDVSTKTLFRFWMIPLAIVAAIVVFLWAWPALIMIFVAFFLAIVLNRPTAFLAKHIKSRSASATISMIGLILIVILAFSTIIPLFAKQTVSFVSSLPDTFSQIQDSSGAVYEFIRDHGLEDQYDQVIDSVKDGVVGVASSAAQNVVGVFGSLLNGILIFVLVLIMAFFMLVEGPMWLERFWRLAYRSKKKREHHSEIATRMYNVISGYVNGTAVIGLLSALLGGLGLCVMTLIAPVPVDVIIPSMLVMFICAFIPMFGAGIAGVIICLLLLLYSWPAALVFAVYFTVYQQIENNIFMPKIFAKHIKISPLTVLVAVVIGTYCGGFLGIFISIPVAGCLQILIREFIVKKKLGYELKVQKAKAEKAEKLKNAPEEKPKS